MRTIECPKCNHIATENNIVCRSCFEQLQAELEARCNQCVSSETKKAFDRYQEFTHHFLHYLQKIGVVTDTSDTVEDLQDKLQAELDKAQESIQLLMKNGGKAILGLETKDKKIERLKEALKGVLPRNYDKK